jgi:hypothetical protein
VLTIADVHKSIKASAHALGLKHPRIDQDETNGIFVGLTHIENNMEILYVGISDENFSSLLDALTYLDTVLRTDVNEQYQEAWY